MDDIYKLVFKFRLSGTNCVMPGVVQTCTVSIIIIIIIIIIMFVIYSRTADDVEVHSLYLYDFFYLFVWP